MCAVANERIQVFLCDYPKNVLLVPHDLDLYSISLSPFCIHNSLSLSLAHTLTYTLYLSQFLIRFGAFIAFIKAKISVTKFLHCKQSNSISLISKLCFDRRLHALVERPTNIHSE